MRLIDKESLIEHMRKAYKGNIENGFKWDLECAVVVIECEEEINQPIVRCKDCKYWDDNYSMCRRYVPNELKDDFNADDFCSKGERAE